MVVGAVDKAELVTLNHMEDNTDDDISQVEVASLDGHNVCFSPDPVGPRGRPS